MPIAVKDAVHTASEYLADVMRISPQSLVLEEVELNGDEHSWDITFSYPTPETADLRHILKSRSYKTVRVEADSGKLLSIKIKNI